jgi:hypothetical protein
LAARPLSLILITTAIVGACIGGDPSDVVATPSPSASVASPSPASSTPTMQPSPSSSPSQIPTTSPEPTESASVEPTPTLAPAEAVEACSGTDDNRAFFVEAAENLDWPVYCPVLPARWSVETGSYSGRGVGLLEITYVGPSGATLSLHEGGFCETSDGCVPAGTDTGDAAFGDQPGTLVTLDDGGYAIVVGRADTPSWLAVATGVDEQTFRSFAEAFVRLD